MKDSITVSRKVLWGIAPMAAILGILFAQGKTGPALLFLIGAIGGIVIGRLSIEKK